MKKRILLLTTMLLSVGGLQGKKYTDDDVLESQGCSLNKRQYSVPDGGRLSHYLKGPGKSGGYYTIRGLIKDRFYKPWLKEIDTFNKRKNIMALRKVIIELKSERDKIIKSKAISYYTQQLLFYRTLLRRDFGDKGITYRSPRLEKGCTLGQKGLVYILGYIGKLLKKAENFKRTLVKEKIAATRPRPRRRR